MSPPLLKTTSYKLPISLLQSNMTNDISKAIESLPLSFIAKYTVVSFLGGSALVKVPGFGPFGAGALVATMGTTLATTELALNNYRGKKDCWNIFAAGATSAFVTGGLAVGPRYAPLWGVLGGPGYVLFRWCLAGAWATVVGTETRSE